MDLYDTHSCYYRGSDPDNHFCSQSCKEMSKLLLIMTSGQWPYQESQTINLYLQTRNNVNILSRFIKILQLLKPYLPLYGFFSRLFLLLTSRLMVTALTLT